MEHRRSPKAFVYEMLFAGEGASRAASIVQSALMLLIIGNVFAVMIDSVEAFSDQYEAALDIFEMASVYVFLVEYLLRLWSVTCDPRYAHPILGRLRYACTPLAIIDLMAVLPFFFPATLAFDTRHFRIVRLMRTVLVLKLTHHHSAIGVIVRVVRNAREELMVALMVALILLVLSSSLMYYVEKDAQPDKFSSIPATLWWGVETLSTIGYGDMYPITPLGKVVAGIMAFISIGMFALPAGIISSEFIQEFGRVKRRKNGDTCPHCGQPLHDHAEPPR
ncbi:MAG: ion transporter [Candidatus Hydrogenedens sp.]|nr:ion transporter [Candidatus Hydrogenedens sp.]